MDLPLAASVDDEALYALCQENRLQRIERTERGDLERRPLVGGECGRRRAVLVAAIGAWARHDGRGVAFAATGFILPNRAMRSPVVAWIAGDRWTSLTADQRRTFPPLAPDFVADLWPPFDRLDDAHAKMREWIENGVRLGWLVDPDARVVWLYRPGGVVERLDDPATISVSPCWPGSSSTPRRCGES